MSGPESSVLRRWLRPARPDTVVVLTDPRERRLVVTEILVVLTVTLGLRGLSSAISLLNAALQPVALNQQQVALNAPAYRLDLVDLAYQLVGVLQLVGWGALGAYLLVRGGFALRAVGLDATRPGRDTAAAAGLAALIGVPGLGLYLIALSVGASLNIAPSLLSDTWWRTPVLIASAAANAWAEEVVLLGYLLTRFRQLGWSENKALLVQALVRGSYHLYQGLGGFIGNVVMGLIFGRFWQRTNRLWALVLGHTIIDVVAFLGYALLAGHVSWLP